MANIFLSYAHEDRAFASRLADALAIAGWSVWWDRSIVPGSTFEEVIEAELNAAPCVIVLWSAQSRQSNWVHDEATEAQHKGVLVSATIDGVLPPLGFRKQQTADLTHWDGSTGAPDFLMLSAGIRRLLPAEKPVAVLSRREEEPGAAHREASDTAGRVLGGTNEVGPVGHRRERRVWIACLAVLAVAAGSYLYIQSSRVGVPSPARQDVSSTPEPQSLPLEVPAGRGRGQGDRHPTSPVPGPGEAKVILHNNTHNTIVHVYFGTAQWRGWSGEQLSDPIPPGGTYTWPQLQPGAGVYDLKAEDSNHQVLDQQMGVLVRGTYDWYVSGKR